MIKPFAASGEIMEWISTKDEREQITQETVLIKAAEGVVEAWFDIDTFEWVCFDDKFTLTPDEVTHWMPLPEPPNKEQP